MSGLSIESRLLMAREEIEEMPRAIAEPVGSRWRITKVKGKRS